MQRKGLFDGHLLGRPPIHGHEAGLAGNNAALRHGFKISHAIGAGDREQLGIRIHRNPRLHIGGVLAHFGGILGGPHGLDFREAHHGVQGNHARIEMLSLELNRLCAVGRNGFPTAAILPSLSSTWPGDRVSPETVCTMAPVRRNESAATAEVA